jgi:hypothetical protein
MAFESEIPATEGEDLSPPFFAVFSSGRPWPAFVAVATNRYNCHGREMFDKVLLEVKRRKKKKTQDKNREKEKW